MGSLDYSAVAVAVASLSLASTDDIRLLAVAFSAPMLERILAWYQFSTVDADDVFTIVVELPVPIVGAACVDVPNADLSHCRVVLLSEYLLVLLVFQYSLLCFWLQAFFEIKLWITTKH